jgi:hypothetical protein
LNGSLVQLDKNTVVDLTQTEKLKDLARSRMELVDTTNANNKGELGFIRNVVVVGFAGITLQLNSRTLLLAILVDVLFRTLENFDFLRLGGLKRHIK